MSKTYDEDKLDVIIKAFDELEIVKMILDKGKRMTEVDKESVVQLVEYNLRELFETFTGDEQDV